MSIATLKKKTMTKRNFSHNNNFSLGHTYFETFLTMHLILIYTLSCVSKLYCGIYRTKMIKFHAKSSKISKI